MEKFKIETLKVREGLPLGRGEHSSRVTRQAKASVFYRESLFRVGLGVREKIHILGMSLVPQGTFDYSGNIFIVILGRRYNSPLVGKRPDVAKHPLMHRVPISPQNRILWLGM